MKTLSVLLLTAALLAVLAGAHDARNVTGARRSNPALGNRQGEPAYDEDFLGPSDPNYEVVTKAPDNLSGPAPLPTDLNCVCVPYYQCDSNQNVNQDGEGIIDIRIKEGACEHYLDYCCNLKDGGDPATPTSPSQPQQPQQPEPSYPTQPEQPQQPSYPEPELPSNPPTQRPPRPQQPDKEFHPTPPPQQMQCGVRNPEGVGFRITGAEDGEAQFGEFPWMVAILQQERIDDQAKPLNLYQCGGALIHPQVVLTGAHCVAGKQPNLLKIRAGEWDTQTTKEVYAHQDRGVAQIIVHPQFNPRSLHNDIALLVLLDPVQVGGHIGVICLPEQDQPFDHKRCFASGWGKNKFEQDGQYQVILKKLDLPIVPHAECQELLRKTRLGAYFLLDASFICAGGEPGRDTCRGDGGSPLVCPIENQPNRYYHAGIVAWGIDCGLPNVPAVYGSVAYFRNWVDYELQKLNVDTSGYRA